jgi:predicted NUDIX family NTP pyrophosphohydrolase
MTVSQTFRPFLVATPSASVVVTGLPVFGPRDFGYITSPFGPIYATDTRATVAREPFFAQGASMSRGDVRSRESAGTILYRRRGDELEVLLVHPAGAYNRRAPWGIPKGHPNPDEPLEIAARRETMEETGIVAGELIAAGFVDYTRSRKRVYGFVGAAPVEASPRCASWEVDKAEFIEVTRARRIIHPDQAILLDRMEKLLAGEALDVAAG